MTNFGKILVHWPTSNAKGAEEVIEVLRGALDSAGVTLASYETIGLPKREYKIAPCTRCNYLTIEPKSLNLLSGDLTDIEQDIRRFLHVRSEGVDGYVCEDCADYL